MPKSLRTRFIVNNKGTEVFDFQALLHTYYKIPSIQDIAITGLQNKKYLDKLKDSEEFNENSVDIHFAEEVDRIYKSAPPAVNLKIDKENEIKIQMSTSNNSDDHDVVLWNPHIAKSKRMGDFGDDEWKNMVCVEPGVVAGWKKLMGGNSFFLEQTISAL